MTTMGLIEKFKLNRPLTEQEIADHLPQKQASRSAPFFRAALIKMNSTFLECPDKWFLMRGMLSAGSEWGKLKYWERNIIQRWW